MFSLLSDELRWEGVGFVHGVLNTDNMSVMGLTIDYGPFAFMEGYDPGMLYFPAIFMKASH